MFSCLTWLKVVLPSVRMGDRTWALEMTWMRKTSARRGRQSLRKARKMRFSPFWLKMSTPESIFAERQEERRRRKERRREERPGRWQELAAAGVLSRRGCDCDCGSARSSISARVSGSCRCKACWSPAKARDYSAKSGRLQGC